MTAPARGGVAGAGCDAVGVVELGFGAGEDLDFVVSLLSLLEDVRVAAVGRLQVDDCGGPAAVDVRVEVLLFVLVEVGAWVGGFVFEHLHEAVEG